MWRPSPRTVISKRKDYSTNQNIPVAKSYKIEFLDLFPKEITVAIIFAKSEFHPTKNMSTPWTPSPSNLVQTLCNRATSVASLTPKNAMTFWMPPVSDVNTKQRTPELLLCRFSAISVILAMMDMFLLNCLFCNVVLMSLAALNGKNEGGVESWRSP